jgi:hypothetical protein
MTSKNLLAAVLSLVSTFAFTACSKQKEAAPAPQQEEISAATLSQIKQLGFTTADAKKVDDGYLVEGDILLTDADFARVPDYQLLRVGTEEQYRTYNLVSVPSSGQRNITVSVGSTLPSAYVAAADEAIRRYNAQNLRIRFTRVSSGANIALTKAPAGAGYLASAGFPSGGNPYNSVKVNSTYMGSNPGTNYLGTIMAHEMGHCIGFRHTDYMSRQYSCGGSPVNEGASTVGAVLVPGTPSGPDPNSWMLACIGTGVNRPFNTNDRTALNYLY